MNFHVRTDLVASTQAAVFLATSLLPLPAMAGPQDLDYPELQVTPRASERLEMEARGESARKFSTHLPVQLSATATLVAGIVQSSNLDPGKEMAKPSATAAMVIGGSWLAITLLMAIAYDPYLSGLKTVREIPRANIRDQLKAERLAEEAIYSASRTGSRIAWISMATNLGAGLFLIIGHNPTSRQIAFDVGAAVLSLAPIIFPYRWQEVAQDHQDYKKKIYGPIATPSVINEPGTKNWVPGLTLTLRF